jgi:hypothetical protein
MRLEARLRFDYLFSSAQADTLRFAEPLCVESRNMRAKRNVRSGPKTDMSFDDLVGERDHLRGNFDTERLCGSQVDDQFELC